MEAVSLQTAPQNGAELTGNALATTQVLGNSLADEHYIKPSIEAGTAGMRLLEEKAGAKRDAT